MKIPTLTVALVAVLGIALAGAPISSHAATTAPAASATPAPAKPKKTPYEGDLTAVDATAGTITVANKSTTLTLTIDAKTVIKKDKKAAKLADFAVGEHVSGSYMTDAAGKTTAASLHEKKAKVAAATAKPTTPAAQ